MQQKVFGKEWMTDSFSHQISAMLQAGFISLNPLPRKSHSANGELISVSVELHQMPPAQAADELKEKF